MKGKILINDSRLTPTMERVRNGRVNLFREKNKQDMAFVSEENCDVRLEHEKKHMFAQLIDGKWYWVNGCNACNGKERFGCYIECDEHNVCAICGIPRGKIEGYAWGDKRGWICQSCNDNEKTEKRNAAFEKLAGEEPDSSFLDKIVCPHCGSGYCDDDINQSCELDCDVCEGEFNVEVEYDPTYSTTCIGDRITE